MSSPLTHMSITVLALLFPDKFNLLALLIGSQLPDLESVVMYFRNLMIKRNVVTTYLNSKLGIMHSFLGIIITFPLGFILYLILAKLSLTYYSNLFYISLSMLLGIISHLLLDVPGHKKFFLFYPFFVIEKNPFLFKLRLGFLEKLYPWRKKEKVKDEFIPEYNWWVFSHIFLILSILLYVLLK